MTDNNLTIAEGLALMAEGLNHLESALDDASRRLIAGRIRRVLQSLADIVNEPDAITWFHDPQWVSLYADMG